MPKTCTSIDGIRAQYLGLKLRPPSWRSIGRWPTTLDKAGALNLVTAIQAHPYRGCFTALETGVFMEKRNQIGKLELIESFASKGAKASRKGIEFAKEQAAARMLRIVQSAGLTD